MKISASAFIVIVLSFSLFYIYLSGKHELVCTLIVPPKNKTLLESCPIPFFSNLHSDPIHHTPSPIDEKPSQKYNQSERLAIVVPFRNRDEHLAVFSRYMHLFMQDLGIEASIWVIEQVDSLPFNRAQLLNVGFLLSKNSSEYTVFHDVDHLPKPNTDYSFFEGVTALHPWQSGYAAACGGVLLVDHLSFERLNGYGRHFWGWGVEDDDFCDRVKLTRTPWRSPENAAQSWILFEHPNTEAEQTLYESNKDVRRKDRLNVWYPQDGVKQQIFEIVEDVQLKYYRRVSVRLFEDEVLKKARGTTGSK